MECVICLTTPEVNSKVYKCKNNHIICNNCLPKMKSEILCEICKSKTKRCLKTEKYISKMPKKFNDSLVDYQVCLKIEGEQRIELENMNKRKREQEHLDYEFAKKLQYETANQNPINMSSSGIFNHPAN